MTKDNIESLDKYDISLKKYLMINAANNVVEKYKKRVEIPSDIYNKKYDIKQFSND